MMLETRLDVHVYCKQRETQVSILLISQIRSNFLLQKQNPR